MTSRPGFVLTGLVLIGALLASVPGLSLAEMQCSFCHQLHGSPGGTLNTAAEFDLICESCHGPAGTAIFTDRHVDPQSNLSEELTNPPVPKPEWENGCIVCHTAHPSDTVNHLYNNGIGHAHTLGGDAGNIVVGKNIKLLGRNEDGTGVARIATPLRIISVGASPSCPNSNTDVEIELPPFSDGEGPLFTIMVGDRITINNANAEFDGSFRVKETAWTTFQPTGGSGWVCFDRPTTAAYTPTGFIRSTGWHNRPLVNSATWAGGSAMLTLRGIFSIRVGDTINVSGVTEVNAGTFNGLKTVTAVTSTDVTNATWSAGQATLTLAENHLFSVGDKIVVSDLLSAGPASFNGQFVLTAVAGSDVSYALASDPGAYTNNGTVAVPQGFSQVAYVSADPGASGASTGLIEYLGSTKAIQDMAVVQPPGLPLYLVTNATWTPGGGPNPGTVVITLDRAHPFNSNDVIIVTGIISSGPGSYNGTFTITNVGSTTTLEYDLAGDPGTYTSGGEIPDPATPPPVLEITLSTNDANIVQFNPATGGLRDGDILNVSGATPDAYNGRWEVESVALPVVTVRCPPYFRTALARPACSLTGFPAYSNGGLVQSAGSMRPVVFESRGEANTDTRYLSDYTHSFTNTDEDQDGWMDGPCETCHTQTANHKNDDFGNTHNNGKTCTAACHTHSQGFDKAGAFCPPGRVCPPVN